MSNTYNSINISQIVINNEDVNSVNAREIHSSLEINKDFSNWIKAQIESLGLEENVDYFRYVKDRNNNLSFLGEVKKKLSLSGKQIDYIVTLDIAKHIAMASRTPKGKEIRKYFIQAEKELTKISNQKHINLNRDILKNFSQHPQGFLIGYVDGLEVAIINGVPALHEKELVTILNYGKDARLKQKIRKQFKKNLFPNTPFVFPRLPKGIFEDYYLDRDNLLFLASRRSASYRMTHEVVFSRLKSLFKGFDNISMLLNENHNITYTEDKQDVKQIDNLSTKEIDIYKNKIEALENKNKGLDLANKDLNLKNKDLDLANKDLDLVNRDLKDELLENQKKQIELQSNMIKLITKKGNNE